MRSSIFWRSSSRAASSVALRSAASPCPLFASRFTLSCNRSARSASRSCSPARRRRASWPACPALPSTLRLQPGAAHRRVAVFPVANRRGHDDGRRAARFATAARARAGAPPHVRLSRSPDRDSAPPEIGRRVAHLLGDLAQLPRALWVLRTLRTLRTFRTLRTLRTLRTFVNLVKPVNLVNRVSARVDPLPAAAGSARGSTVRAVA